jgi:hypothetical protein
MFARQGLPVRRIQCYIHGVKRNYLVLVAKLSLEIISFVFLVSLWLKIFLGGPADRALNNHKDTKNTKENKNYGKFPNK